MIETANVWQINGWLREEGEKRHRAAPWFTAA